MQRISHRQNSLFSYQGKEKPADGSLWDQFELRLYNHDLGRWFAPDPYNQFHSPYVGMGNNPVSGVDPDGGFTASYGSTNAGSGSNDNVSLRNPTMIKFFIRGATGGTSASSEGSEHYSTMADLSFDVVSSGGGGGGGGIWGGDPMSGGISWEQLDKQDGKVDGKITDKETGEVLETQEGFNNSIAPSYTSVQQRAENGYNAWVAHLGEGYNTHTGQYGYYQSTGSNNITVTGNNVDGYSFSEVQTGLEWVSSDANKVIGTISINSSVNGLDHAGTGDGHSWLEITNNDGGSCTVSTWGNYSTGSGNDIRYNIELQRNYKSEAKRTKPLTVKQAIILQTVSKQYKEWTTWNTCAGFSTSLWNLITGEGLNAEDQYGTQTPRALIESINYWNTNLPLKK